MDPGGRKEGEGEEGKDLSNKLLREVLAVTSELQVEELACDLRDMINKDLILDSRYRGELSDE